MSLSIQVPVQNNGVEAPAYSTEGAAALDLRATKATTIPPGCRALVHTSIHAAIPEGYAALVMPRSGLALKYGITVLNSPGLVDPDYRGEIGVVLQNHSDVYFDVRVGDRVAQLMFVPFARAEFKFVDALDDTARGTGGFGSTGHA